MATTRRLPEVSRRERQCLDVLFARGQATVSEVRQRLDDPPSYSAVRATLNTLVEKGLAHTTQDGPRYVYMPTMPADTARNAAVRHLVSTFFGGSAEEAVVALLQMSDTKVSRDAIEKLNRKVQAARKEGR
jgi:predicted transcriptional regulator